MQAKNPEAKEKYFEYGQLDLPSVDEQILKFWTEEKIFDKSLQNREGNDNYVFYEGPPSANGKPGIHHVISRTIKDLFCRYKTLKGYKVDRKGGWDTHGLPVELSVEKTLGITKKDIGSKITVEEYNEFCKKEVLKYKDIWDDLTMKMGYWVDLNNPYITFENYYIESLWGLLKRLYDNDFLYKGYTIQPFSPAAGTQLSSHELNLPGAYRDVKDTSVTAQFKIKGSDNDFILAWTTTPWTLPSNTALAVGDGIVYLKVETYNPYTFKKVNLIIAKELLSKYFKAENADLNFDEYQEGDKKIPYRILEEMKGSDLVGMEYEQLIPVLKPSAELGDAFRVISGDFVSTEDGTGIVHIAPTFGADDMRVAKAANIAPMLVQDKDNPRQWDPLVDKQGKFVEEAGWLAGKYVKNYHDDPAYESVDIDIAVHLKQENRAFKVEKYEHSYPHCWRTDKPVIYYPLDSWFIKTTAVKDRMVALNKEINWKPASTGEGRFGQWLENLVDWNLSRSRFWGTPLPIWRTENGSEEICIGSIAQLQEEVKKAVEAGFMEKPLADDFDLHKPYVDDVFLCSSKGEKMTREPDLIDVWFDSGAMPYAQWHYPIENEEIFKKNFPADFIAEGVDQTRGWFYTLHAIAVMLFDSVAYKNVVSNGLVLDKEGNKMSKRVGNVVEPFETLKKYGADPTRWYMMANSQPWDNTKFDVNGIEEVRRKFFGTVFNTYAFFALYANIDGFKYEEENINNENRQEIDRWIISLLNTLIKEVDEAYADYEPTKAVRLIQDFVDNNLSNWYVRLCRRRFWKGDYTEDKIAAYQTLYYCLEVIAQITSPVSPFFSDFLFRNLNRVSKRFKENSVHLTDFPKYDHSMIDRDLEERMKLAQEISSMVLSLRKREKIKVRQPLSKILIPVLDPTLQHKVAQVEHYILSEINVKEIEYVTDTSGVIVKKIKPDFKKLGPKFGPMMKDVSKAINDFGQDEINTLEMGDTIKLSIAGKELEISREEVEISSEDIPGWLVSSSESVTVALDVTITDLLKAEGNAREFVNRIQNLRKDKSFNVTDRIKVELTKDNEFHKALDNFKDYICSEILAEEINELDNVAEGNEIEVNDILLQVNIQLN
ncbi:MAG: isoleucine--tRNA ligase [Chitinophagales bacterium]|nr:isoleucine--tRNA ligase [Chitinophagales bacterium]